MPSSIGTAAAQQIAEIRMMLDRGPTADTPPRPHRRWLALRPVARPTPEGPIPWPTSS